MKESNDILDTIERYTKNKMGVEEKVVFEKELATDESLRKQLQFSEIIDEMIIGNETWKLKEQMQKDLYSTTPKLGKYLAISVLMLATSAGLFVLFNREDKVKVETPITVEPKAIKQAQKQVEISKKIIFSKTKLPVSKEHKTSVQATSTTPEFKITSVQPEGDQTITVSSTAQVVASPNVASKQNVTLSVKQDPCASLVGDVEFYTIASCKGQETGEVRLKIETIKGGTAPFSFKLGEKSASGYFDRLAPGQYTLFIKDANNCLIENAQKVIVSEKKCVVKKEYIFNPEYDSSWPIPYDTEKQAIAIKILDKSGKVFYQSNVSTSHPAEWRGESNTGLVLGMGLYFFSIEYADGSFDEGSILVSR